MKHLFVINPISGNNATTEKLVQAVHKIGSEMSLDYSIVYTQRTNHALEIVKNAVSSGGEWRVYACGGDGTLNEVVCGAAGHDNVAVGHYPRGTGNDFIKCFPGRNFLDVRNLIAGETKDIDCIDLDGGRYAINICSVGTDADIAADMQKFRWATYMGGKMPYNLSTITNVIKGVGRYYTVEVDGACYNGKYTLLTACSGQVYGGGFHACPDADPSDGNFEFLLVRKLSRFEIAKIIGIYAEGGYKKLPQYIRHITGKVMRIQADAPFNVNYDGEIFRSNDVTMKFAPHKIKFILP